MEKKSKICKIVYFDEANKKQTRRNKILKKLSKPPNETPICDTL